MEGCGKNATSGTVKYRIPKKKPNAQSNDDHVQSPLSRLSDVNYWDKPLIEWKARPRNNNLHYPIWKRRRHLEKSCIGDEGQPKVILTNVLRTKKGRKYVQRHLLADANLSDASKLQSDEQLSSSIASLESCQKISSQQSCTLSKRYGKYNQTGPKDCLQKLPREAENNNALLTIRRCDVVLEDLQFTNYCSRERTESDQQERRRKYTPNPSPGLRETSFQNSVNRKRRGDDCPNQIHAPEKSPLPRKEERTEPVQPLSFRNSSATHESHMHSHQQENILQPLELACSKILPTTNISCPRENCSNASPKRNLRSVKSKGVQILQRVASARRPELTTTLSLKEPLNRPEKRKERADSTEPIVLSSDEEENAEAKDPEMLLQTRKDHRHDNKEREQESPLRLSEELSQSITEKKPEQISAEPLTLQSCADCGTFTEQMDLALDIKFAMLYIGKYKGKALGCAEFTTKYIKIPFEVAIDTKMELLVDSMHLRKFGLWINDDSSTIYNAIIFLWLSSDYTEQIENWIGTSILNKQAKGTKFAFITLSQRLTEEEQVLLNKIIVEVSKKNATSDLTDFLPWEQAFVLLKDLAPKENSFIDYCSTTFQQQSQKDSTSVPAEPPPPPEPNSNFVKPNYTMLLKRNSGQYSFSVSSVQRNEWKELRDIGPVRNLIVYPPPPARGGLGVTREDLECLECGEFLNDVIIDFYLKYLWLERAPKPLADRSHIFSSFFYKCLTRTENNSEEHLSISLAERRHKRVKRWTRHINIFSKDYIFVPVNEKSHWYIAVICFPWLEKVMYEDCLDNCSQQSHLQQFPLQPEMKSKIGRTETVLVFNDNWNDKEELDVNSDPQPKDNVQHATSSAVLESKMAQSSSSNSKVKKVCKRPCILILDSLKTSSVQNTVQVLREYLEVEWEAKCKTCREFSKSAVVDFCPRVPKQNNSSDCGVYLLQYVETFFQNPIVNFELPMHLERWFPRQVVKSKREEIRDLILQLHLQQQSGSKS
ncbi:sentrin-specific protease 7 isoform X2 [Tiliqua scincoides]|uniref:sentrin-specific protease 7 isoform X2 n=1 Tax=Tiliqua scincoides TaxID=71010 RepID=UPI0034625E77